MSTFQVKKTLISAEPRPVIERIVETPRISFIASSIGRVMVAIISVGRHDAVVDEKDHPGKVRLREDGRREGQGRVDAGGAQGDADEDNGERVPGREPAKDRLVAHQGCRSSMMWILVSPVMP